MFCLNNKVLDEQLIDEVANHGVIYNRQKYYLNGSNVGGKYETKDEAWEIIAMKLGTDVETCKKRWKYLRERYVSQRKQGDPPVYEHLSRPYLEKMKFLDQHIQPRKSYRNVTSFLTSPHSANSSNYGEYAVDSKSNGSMHNLAHFGNSMQHHYGHQQQQQHDQHHAMNALTSAAAAASAMEGGSGPVKIEAEAFRDLVQHMSQSQMHQHAVAAAAVLADNTQGGYHQHHNESYRNGVVDTPLGMVAAAAAAQHQASNGSVNTNVAAQMKTPLSSPLNAPLNNNNNNNGVSQSTPTPPTVSAAALQATVQQSISSANALENNDNLPTYANTTNNGNGEMNPDSNGHYHAKRPRLQMNKPEQNNGSDSQNNGQDNGFVGEDSDDDSDENSQSQIQSLQQDNHFNSGADMPRITYGTDIAGNQEPQEPFQQGQHHAQQQQQQPSSNIFTSNTELMLQFLQQLPQQQPSGAAPANSLGGAKSSPLLDLAPRSTEQLFGELLTSELLKMDKERRRSVQKRVLELLFFDE